MVPHVCDIVSPHLLDVLANSEDNATSIMARTTLAHATHIRARRKQHLEEKHWASLNGQGKPTFQGIVPDQLLDQVIESDTTDATSKRMAQHTLDIKQQAPDGAVAGASTSLSQHTPKMTQHIYDMQSQEQKIGSSDETYKLLPGTLVRSECQNHVSDERANQAFENCEKILQFYREVFGYEFLDGKGPLISSIHFEKNYQNASWIGDSIQQMVYGDGGGNLYNFTACLDIIGHEMTHAVIEHRCGLQYQGESGALNEHVSDVFGMLVTLWDEKKTTAQSDWLIGEGCLVPGIKGVALRNMKFPGTAYDDPKFGKDPQPASWAEIEAYKAKHKYWASYDHGSVHAFSGVPNRAFVLASEAFGGYVWEKTGKIWWTTITTQRIPPDCTFIQFSDVTIQIAKELFGDDASSTVRKAWNDVGITGSPTSVSAR